MENDNAKFPQTKADWSMKNYEEPKGSCSCNHDILVAQHIKL